MEINTDKKFAAVLDKKLPQAVAMNALAHMAACVVSRYPDAKEMGFVDYLDKDGGKHPVSALTFILLEGSSNKIRTLRNESMNRGVHFVDFTSTMIQGTHEEEMERTRSTHEAELEYCGICLFGDKEVISELTKKFSLWK